MRTESSRRISSLPIAMQDGGAGALRDRIPASYSAREMVEAGLLMSYGDQPPLSGPGGMWSDDRYGHFRNLAARCSTPAVPGMRARPPMEAGGCLGGPGSEARSYWVKMSSRDVPADFKCSKCSAHYKVVRRAMKAW